jgi:hypothetical protein
MPDALRSGGVTPELEVAIGDGSLAPETDIQGYGATVHYVVRTPDAQSATRAARAVRAELSSYVSGLQSEAGVPRSTWILIKDVAAPVGASPVSGSASRALLALSLLTLPQYVVVKRLLAGVLAWRKRQPDDQLDRSLAVTPGSTS